ncbi:MAG: glycosyltransferase, partial [bacterium]
IVAIPQRSGIGTRGQTPAKLIDAMALAKPILATRVEEITEVVGDDAAVLVDPGDVSGLRRGVEWLLAHPDEARQMGQAARRRFEASFSLSGARERMQRVLEAAAAAANS